MVVGMSPKYVEGFKDLEATNDTETDVMNNSSTMNNTTDVEETITTKPKITMAAKRPSTTRANPVTTKPKAIPSTTKGNSRMTEETTKTTKMAGKKEMKTNNKKNNKNKFIDIKNKVEGEELADLEDREPVNMFEIEMEDRKHKKALNTKKDNEKAKNQNNREESNVDDENYGVSDEYEEDIEEGFHGSQIVESRSMKNILLSLLIAFLGYIVAMAAVKNLLPIVEYAPDFKKFKNIIYAAVFFGIVYLCLEIFGC
jgi:hypothetical protein